MSSGLRFGAERFEEIYAADADPWHYLSSDYEQEKYARTLAALPARRLDRVLEVGCSIGAFTERLAPHCGSVVAIDFSERAVTIARERLRERDNVEVLSASFPEDAPRGPWDLVICSEVLYYLDRPGLNWAIAWLRTQLHLGSDILVVSWRGTGSDEPFRGAEVHARLHRDLARWLALSENQPGYLLDRFDADGA